MRIGAGGRGARTDLRIESAPGCYVRDGSSRVGSGGPAEEPTTTPSSGRLVLGLSLPQVVGSSLAAGTAALAGSFLGVQGTLVGAVVGSVVATVGTAVYAHSLDRAAGQLRAVRTVVRTQPPATTSGADGGLVADPDDADARSELLAPAPLEGPPRGRGWLRLATAVAVGVAVALAAITAVELIIGHPVSGSTTSGTSIGQAVGAVPARRTVGHWSHPVGHPVQNTCRVGHGGHLRPDRHGIGHLGRRRDGHRSRHPGRTRRASQHPEQPGRLEQHTGRAVPLTGSRALAAPRGPLPLVPEFLSELVFEDLPGGVAREFVDDV